MKRRAWICLFAGAFLYGGCGAGTDRSTAVTTEGTIQLTDTLRTASVTDIVDLGAMRGGEVVRRDMTLRNGTSVPLVLLSVSTGCGCTSVDYPRQPLQPGAEAPFSFAFDSRGFSGVQYKRISIRTSLGDKPYVLIVVADVSR